VVLFYHNIFSLPILENNWVVKMILWVGIATDTFGRTNIQGVYVAGDASKIFSYGMIYAAAEGSRAAVGVNTDLTQKDF
jgi:thioredoxin reductase